MRNYDWKSQARDEQLAPTDPYWNVWLMAAGRGAGKTRAAMEWVRQEALKDKVTIAIVARDHAMARGVLIEGEPGLLNIHSDEERPAYYPALRKLEWPNGSKAYIISAFEPDMLRGPEYDFAVGDDIESWPLETYENLLLSTRKGSQPRIVLTATPKDTPIIREVYKNLVDYPFQYRMSRMTTLDNHKHLNPVFLDYIKSLFDGTGVAKQVLEGEFPDDFD